MAVSSHRASEGKLGGRVVTKAGRGAVKMPRVWQEKESSDLPLGGPASMVEGFQDSEERRSSSKLQRQAYSDQHEHLRRLATCSAHASPLAL